MTEPPAHSFRFSLKQVTDWLVNVWRLQRTVETLAETVTRLEREVARLQKQVDLQTGELRILANFVESSIYEQVEVRAERAAVRVLERLSSAAKAPKAKRKERRPRTKT